MSLQMMAKVLAFKKALQQFQSMQCIALNSGTLVQPFQNKKRHALKARLSTR